VTHSVREFCCRTTQFTDLTPPSHLKADLMSHRTLLVCLPAAIAEPDIEAAVAAALAPYELTGTNPAGKWDYWESWREFLSGRRWARRGEVTISELLETGRPDALLGVDGDWCPTALFTSWPVTCAGALEALPPDTWLVPVDCHL